MRKLTITDINQRLIDGDRSISLLKYGNNIDDRTSRWKCNKCGHEWFTGATHILNYGTGCASCSRKLRLTPKTITQRLIEDERNISLLSFGNNGNDSQSEWKCDKCGHAWCTNADNVLNKNSGCPSCAGNIQLTEEIVIQRLIEDERNISLLSFTMGNKNISLWQCHDCDHKWYNNIANILRGQGCPHCADYGFNPGKPAFVYLHTFNGFIKIGITNKLDQRHAKLDNQTINETLYTIESTMSWYFEDGAEAQDLESTILGMFKQHSYTKLLETAFDGKTELFESTVHQKILDYIKDNYDISLV